MPDFIRSKSCPKYDSLKNRESPIKRDDAMISAEYLRFNRNIRISETRPMTKLLLTSHGKCTTPKSAPFLGEPAAIYIKGHVETIIELMCCGYPS